LTIVLLLTITFSLTAKLLVAQELPQPSPWAETEQMVGLAKVKVVYSRPSMKGRKIFGDIVPLDEVWRTGANASTKISFDDAIAINGKNVEAGEYSLYTIPGKTTWTVIINKNTGLWGSGGYDIKDDVARMEITPTTIPTTQTFTIDFSDLGDGTANLNLYWENTKVSIPLKNDYKEKALANINSAIAEAEGSYRTYEGAAEYYMDNNMDLDQALTWAKKSVDMSPKFWNVYTLSRVYAAKGMYKEAIEKAEYSLKLAQEANYKTYIDMNTKNIAEWKTKL
ncbi:MAG: DUF2911 domain-containing protein, partial [Chitinophagales bacterium]|nr:DUF2911 domain-containing protein [Chitinophagales bacterium]